MGTGWDMGLLLDIVGVILVILGIVWLFNGAIFWGLVAIVVGALIAGSYHGYYGRRRL